MAWRRNVNYPEFFLTIVGMVVVGWLGRASTTLHYTHHVSHQGSRDTSVSFSFICHFLLALSSSVTVGGDGAVLSGIVQIVTSAVRGFLYLSSSMKVQMARRVLLFLACSVCMTCIRYAAAVPVDNGDEPTSCVGSDSTCKRNGCCAGFSVNIGKSFLV